MAVRARSVLRCSAALLTGTAGSAGWRCYNGAIRAGHRRSSSRDCSGDRTRIAHMRLLLVVLLVGSLLQIAQAPATAAPAEQSASGQQGSSAAQMTVRAGFDGLGKVGGWLPIEVEVRNDGPDIDGEIQIVVTDTNVSRGTYTRAPAVYSAPAILPRRSHKRIMLEAELRATGQKLQARLVEGGNVVSEQDIQLTR